MYIFGLLSGQIKTTGGVLTRQVLGTKLKLKKVTCVSILAFKCVCVDRYIYLV